MAHAHFVRPKSITMGRATAAKRLEFVDVSADDAEFGTGLAPSDARTPVPTCVLLTALCCLVHMLSLRCGKPCLDGSGAARLASIPGAMLALEAAYRAFPANPTLLVDAGPTLGCARCESTVEPTMRSSEVTHNGCLTGLVRGAENVPTGCAGTILALVPDYCPAPPQSQGTRIRAETMATACASIETKCRTFFRSLNRVSRDG